MCFSCLSYLNYVITYEVQSNNKERFGCPKIVSVTSNKLTN